MHMIVGVSACRQQSKERSLRSCGNSCIIAIQCSPPLQLKTANLLNQTSIKSRVHTPKARKVLAQEIYVSSIQLENLWGWRWRSGTLLLLWLLKQIASEITVTHALSRSSTEASIYWQGQLAVCKLVWCIVQSQVQRSIASVWENRLVVHGYQSYFSECLWEDWLSWHQPHVKHAVWADRSCPTKACKAEQAVQSTKQPFKYTGVVENVRTIEFICASSAESAWTVKKK